MGKYLTDSAGTGEKIIRNFSDFLYNCTTSEPLSENLLYRFNWQFNDQHGYISIVFDKTSSKIANSSLIDTDNDSSHKFGRPLGLYNDQTLYSVFQKLMESQGIYIDGIFSDN